MGDTYSRVGSVDGLSAVAGSAENIDSEVVRVNFDISFFSFREDGDSNGTRVNSSLAFSGWNTLYTVYTRLKLEL